MTDFCRSSFTKQWVIWGFNPCSVHIFFFLYLCAHLKMAPYPLYSRLLLSSALYRKWDAIWDASHILTQAQRWMWHIDISNTDSPTASHLLPFIPRKQKGKKNTDSINIIQTDSSFIVVSLWWNAVGWWMSGQNPSPSETPVVHVLTFWITSLTVASRTFHSSHFTVNKKKGRSTEIISHSLQSSR